MNPDEIILVILSLLSWIVIPTLYRIFKEPIKALRKGHSKNILFGIFFLYAGLTLISLVMGGRFFSALFVGYPIFYAVLNRKKLRSLKKFSSRFALFIFPLFLLWFGELFAVLDYHGPVFQHYLFYTGYYLGYAIVIHFFFCRWSFSFTQVMSIGGLFGVLIEQEFMLPGLLFQAISGIPESFLFFLLAVPFIFLTHGFYLAGPYLLFYEEIILLPKAGRRHIVWLFLALLIIPLLSWGVWSFFLSGAGIDINGVI